MLFFYCKGKNSREAAVFMENMLQLKELSGSGLLLGLTMATNVQTQSKEAPETRNGLYDCG